jgi:hypothetical protein
MTVINFTLQMSIYSRHVLREAVDKEARRACWAVAVAGTG